MYLAHLTHPADNHSSRHSPYPMKFVCVYLNTWKIDVPDFGIDVDLLV